MKVLDRNTIHEAPVQLPELPDDVTIPDDLRGLEPMGGADRSRLATTVRWLRWLPLVLLVAAGAVLFTGNFGGDTGDTTVPWAVDEGPGSNSLDGAVASLVVVPAVTQGPFAANKGPGSQSLEGTSSSQGWAASQGPGSHSLATTGPSQSDVPWTADEGPGSHSMTGGVAAQSSVTQSDVPWSEGGGPGSNSMGS